MTLKYFIRVCLFTVVAVFFLTGCTSQETVSKGVLDLQNKDLTSHLVKLTGEWEEFRNELTDPADLPQKGSSYRKLPGVWNSSESTPNPPRCATYRCTIVLPKDYPDSLTIFTKEQIDCYSLFINGKLLLSDGVPSIEKSKEIPSAILRSGSFDVKSDTLVCVLQVSSYHFNANAGPLFPIFVGIPEVVNRHLLFKYIVYALILGVMLILGIQNLVLYVQFRQEKSYLYFSLYCLIWGLIGFVETDNFRFATLLFPQISFEALYRLYVPFLVASMGVTCLFFNAVFQFKYLKRAIPLILSLCTIEIVIGLFLPLPFVAAQLPIFLFIIEIAMFLLLGSVISGIKKKQIGSYTLLIGLILYIASAINDTLNLDSTLSNGFLMLFGVTALILSQALVLAMRHAQTYNKHELLLGDMIEKNSELNRLSKIKDEFLANTSHELRTPLHGIIGISESILEGKEQLSSFVRSNVNIIESSGRRLINLVNSILDFSKMRNDDLSIHIENVDICQCVDIVIPHFIRAAEKKNVILERSFENSHQLVRADEERLIQILFNLIGNAIKFTDRGSVSVMTSIVDNALLLEIKDTGIGISENDLTEIFEPFKQSSEETHGYRGGTGLGLSITKDLIELQGGGISVKSELGEGSVFSVTFLLAEEGSLTSSRKLISSQVYSDVETEELPVQITHDKPTPSGLVLAIDDEPTNLQIIQNHLSAEGVFLLTSETGENALDLIEKHKPAIILLDIMMPIKNGYQVCREIREHYSASEMPILFISAKNRIEDLVLGFEVGGNDYILKPFLKQELLARTSLHIKQREAFLILKENLELKSNLAEAILEKEQLLTSQKQLIALLHTLPESIMLVDSEEEIVFVNIQFSTCFKEEVEGRPIGEIMHLDNATGRGEIVAPVSDEKFLSQVLHRSIEMDGEFLRIITLANESTSAQYSNRIFDEITRSEKRITEIDSLFEESGRSHEILTKVHLQERDAITEAVELMELVVSIWELTTHKTRVDFAEASGLWKVNRDKDGWGRAVTLNKYLSVSKIPRFPKWNKIFSSAQWLLDNCNPKGKLLKSKKEELEKRYVSLQKLRMT